MKQKIHPKYNDEIKVTCVCGNEFTTGSTDQALDIEVCSACHPFYTGKQKFVGAAGRVDKFRQRVKAAEKKVQKESKKNDVKKESTDEKATEEETVKLG